MDLDVVAENDAAGIGCHMPREAKFLSVDLAADGEAGSGVAPGIFDDAAEFHFEFDVLCDAVQGQIAVDIKRPVVIYVLNFGKDEFHLRVGSHIKEISGFHMGVALFVLGIDGGDVDGKRGLCGREVFVLGADVGGEGGEGAGHGRDHQMLYFKFYFRMCGVQYPFCNSHLIYFNV